MNEETHDMPMDSEPFQKLGRELIRLGSNKLSAFAEGDNILLMIKDAPEQLRRLADQLEQIDVDQIQAIIAFQNKSEAHDDIEKIEG